MKINFSLLMCCVLLFGRQITLAQNSIVTVSPLTGTATTIIPVYNLSRGQVTLPINLVYSATGVKPKDVENTAGIGWELQAGGKITRVVRGLPDDCQTDRFSNIRLGWMHNGAASTIAGYTIANTSDSDCTGQSADINFIDSNFDPTIDSEPDIFYVNAPGLSCKLLYENNSSSPKFVTIPYIDVKIETLMNTDGSISSFSITNNEGIKYTFGQTEEVMETTIPISGSHGTFFQNKYEQYKNGIVYADSWFLTSMTDANGNGVELHYTYAPSRPSTDDIILYNGGGSSATTTQAQYATQLLVTPPQLSTITVTDDDLSLNRLGFGWITNDVNGTGQTVIGTISGANRLFSFNYGHAYYNNDYVRFFLMGYKDDTGCSTPVNYKFDYYGVEPYLDHYVTSLSDSSSTHNIDYWGYFRSSSATGPVPGMYVNPSNPSYQRYEIVTPASIGADYSYLLTGLNRLADPDSVMTGSLKKITYATGGITNFTYESNDYVETPAATPGVNFGGGLRIKQITDVDNITSKTITRNYAYLNPTTGLSSGKPISLPVYGFATTYTGSATGIDYWYNSTMRSNVDLSDEDHTVVYEYVKESKTGAGSTLNQYLIPATNWSTSASPSCSGCTTAEWFPTTAYNARPACTNYGPPKNDIDTYTFAPNPNYDFERGLPFKSISYNEASTPQKVSETTYSYQRSGSPSIMYGLRYNWNFQPSELPVMAYSKYAIYYGVSELTSTMTKTVYDSGTLSQALTTSVNNTYGSTYHTLASQSTTNSDGSTTSTNYTYVKDFAGLSSGNSNPNIDAIYHLQQLNINTPIETYSTVQRAGSVPSVTSASLTLFQGLTTGSHNMYMPVQLYKFIQPNGGGAFSPIIISGSTLNKDSRYILERNFIEYDFTGVIQTADDAHKHVKAGMLDHISYQPVISVNNAAAYEIAFEDFDSDLIPAWSADSTGTFSGTQPPGSHTGKAHGMSSGETFSYTIQKNAQASNNIFSIWINSPSGGTFNFTLAPVAPSAGSSVTISKTFASTGTSWKYLQFKLPMPLMTSGATVKITAALSSTANIAMDDIIIYPESAEVNTSAYDLVTYNKTADTNTNGLSTYYTTDQWGRLLLQYNQDKNIVLKKSYITPEQYATANPNLIAKPSSGSTLDTFTFSNSNMDACASVGTTYSWSYDGATYTTPSFSSSATHNFATVGTHTAQLKINSPYFGLRTSNVVSVAVDTPSVTINYTNHISAYGTITTVILSQNGSPVYTIPGSSLNGYRIANGVYDIQIQLFGGREYDPGTGTGYESVWVNNTCQSYASSGINTYNFTGVDLSLAKFVIFTVLQDTCF